MDKLDGIVIGEVAKRVLDPERPTQMLEPYVRGASERENTDRDRLAEPRHERKDAEAGIMRLLELVEKGLMHGECEFRRKPAGDSDLIPARVPI